MILRSSLFLSMFTGTLLAGAQIGGGVANDECAGATAITLIEPGDCATMATMGTNTGATAQEPNPSCDPTSTMGFADVWYSFNSGANEVVQITLTPAENMTDWGYAVMLACDSTTGFCTVQPEATNNISGFAPNTNYIVRVFSNLQFGTTGDFTLCIANGGMLPPPPANNECADAVVLLAGPNCIMTPGTTALATQSMAPTTCNATTSSNANDVWYSFVATDTEHTIAVEGIGNFDAVIELFSGACGSLVSMACADETFPNPPTVPAPVHEQLNQQGLTVGQTYHVRVYDWGHFGSSQHTFNICVVEGPAFNVGIDELDKNTFTVFPNPTDGVINITGTNVNGSVEIAIHDMTGRLVHSSSTSMSQDAITTLDLGGRLATGSYNLVLTTSEGRSVQPIIIR